MNNNPDPYDYDGEFDSDYEYEATMMTEYPEQEKIYRSLIGLYRATMDETRSNIDRDIWTSVNVAIDKFKTLGHDYSDYTISNVRPNGNTYVATSTFKSKLMSLLEVISHDFHFSDPNYLIYQYMPSNGPSVYASAHANPSQSTIQEQNNSHNVSVTVEQHMSWVAQELENNFSPEQLEEIKPDLEHYKSNPKKWTFVQKLIIKLLSFGTAVAPIVLKIMENYLKN